MEAPARANEKTGEWVPFPGEKDEEEVLQKVIESSKARAAARSKYRNNRPPNFDQMQLGKIIDDDLLRRSKDFVFIEKYIDELIAIDNKTFLEEILFGINFESIGEVFISCVESLIPF